MVRRTTRSSINNAQKVIFFLLFLDCILRLSNCLWYFCKAAAAEEKLPPASEPPVLHSSPSLSTPPPLPVDRTKIGRVPTNQGIGTMESYLEMQKKKKEMQQQQTYENVLPTLEAHDRTFVPPTDNICTETGLLSICQLLAN